MFRVRGSRPSSVYVRSLAVLAVCAGVGVPAVALADNSNSTAPPVATTVGPRPPADVQQGLDAEQERLEEAAAKQAASPTDPGRFADVDDDEALAILRKRIPALLGHELAPTPQKDPFRYLSNNTALVHDGGEVKQITSMQPLLTRDEKTDRVTPVDPTLETDGSTFAPKKPVSDYAFARTLQNGGDDFLKFERSKFGLDPVLSGSTVARGRRVDDKVVYPNALRDTDIVGASTVSSATLVYALRSANAPTAFSVAATGTQVELAKSADGRLIEVRRGKRVLGRVQPPVASDANGAPVPVTWEVRGRRLTFQVDHRNEKTAFPVVVDPVVVEDQRSWIGDGNLDMKGWEPQRSDYTRYPDADMIKGYAFYGTGLTVYVEKGRYYPAGNYGQFVFNAAGNRNYISENAHISGADFGYTAHLPASGTGSCMYQGVFDWTRGNWETINWRIAVPAGSTPNPWNLVNNGTVTVCGQEGNYGDPTTYKYRQQCVGNPCDRNQVGTSYDPNRGGPGNSAVFAMTSGTGTPTNNGLAYMGASLITQSEQAPPRIISNDAPANWVDKGPVVSALARDYGLGMVSFTASVADPAKNGAVVASGTADQPSCVRAGLNPNDGTYTQGNRNYRGDRNNRCPEPMTVSVDTQGLMNSGTYPVTLAAKDLMNNPASAATTVRIDRTAPDVQWSPDPAAVPVVRPGSTDSSATKTLKFQASDAHSGVKNVAISIDGGAAEPVTQPSCSATQCPTTYDVEIPASRFAGLRTGNHRVEVTVSDGIALTSDPAQQKRHQTKKAFDFVVYQGPGVTPPANTNVGRVTEGGLGFEDWMTYDTTPTGAGSNLRVNLATGGSVWSLTPVSNPGVGLDTVFRLTYNSHEPAGLLPGLLNGTGVFGYGFAGRGFSAQLGSITRVNEPLWFQTSAGVPLPGVQASSGAVQSVVLTDGDGTRQTFTRNDKPGVRFDPPSGVELELRRYTSDNNTDDDREHRWAATRPDGTTFFFGEDGLPTWSEDRNHNRLKLNYETLTTPLVAGCGYALACNKRLKTVVDAATVSQTDLAVTASDADASQRAWTVEYEDGGSHITGILDRKRIGAKPSGTETRPRRHTKFVYDGNNLLTSIVQAENAPNQKRSFALAYLPGSAYLSGITDPAENTTTVTYGEAAPVTGAFSPVLDPLLGTTGLFQDRRAVSSVRDRASTGETSRRTSYTVADSTVADAGSSNPADRTNRLTQVKSPRKVINQIKTDGLGRMTQLVRAFNDTTDPDDLPAANPRTTTQGWTPDNYVAWTTVAAENTAQQVSTDYDWGSLGELRSEYQHSGAHGTTPDDASKKRTQGWSYRRHSGVLEGENSAGREFVYDTISHTDRRQKITKYGYGADNTGRITSIVSPNGGSEQFGYNTRGLITSHSTSWWQKRTEAPTFNTDKPPFSAAEPDIVSEGWSQFDGNGDATRHDDQRGKTQYEQHDAVGNTTFLADPRAGNDPTAFDYSVPESALTSAAEPAGAPATNARANARAQGGNFVARWTYDALDRMVAQAIPKRTTAVQRDADGKPIKGSDGKDLPVPDRFTFSATTFDRNDNPKASTDGEGKTTTRVFTKTDQISSESTPLIAHHDPTSSRDAPANATSTVETTQYQYDAVDNLQERADPLGTLGSGGHRTTWAYNPYDEATVQTRIAGSGSDSAYLTTSRAYDARGNVIGEADPKGNGDINTPATAETNASAAATQRHIYQYDVFDRLSHSIENPATTGDDSTATDVGLDTQYEYDEEDHLVKQTTPAGRSTSYVFDDAGRLSKKSEPFGYDKDARKSTTTADTTYKRRADGEIYEIVAPRGNDNAGLNGFATKLSYYATGELKKRALPRASSQYGAAWEVSYGIDDVGNPVQVTDARTKTFSNTFLDTGELATTTRPSWWIYDQGEGVRERTESDPAPKTSNSGDLPSEPGNGDFGKVQPQTLPDVLPAKGDTSLEYDDELRLKSVSSLPDSGSALIKQSFDYDAIGRLTQRTVPVQGSDSIGMRWQYDAAGTVRAQIDGRGAATDYDYDGFDRLKTQSEPRNCTTATTDPDDPTCARPKTTQAYDLNSNVFQQILPASSDPANADRGTSGKVTTTYDQVDRPISTVDQSNAKTGQAYDRDGLVAAGYRPRAFDGPTDLSPDDVFGTFFDRDGAGRVTKQTERATDTTSTGTTSTQDLITSTTYDRNGNPTRIESPGSKKNPTDAQPKQRVQVRGYDGRDLPWFTTIGDAGDDPADARTTITEYDGNGWLRRTVKPAGVQITAGGDPRPKVADSATQDSTGAGQQTQNAETLEYGDDNGLITARNLPWDTNPNEQNNDDKATSDGARKRYRQQYGYTPRGVLSRVSGVFDDGTGTGNATHDTTIDSNLAGWPVRTSSQDLQGAPHTVEMKFSYDLQGNQTEWSTPGGSRTVQNRYFPSGQLQSRCGVRSAGTGTSGAEEQIYSFRYDRSGAMSRMIDWQHHRIDGNTTECAQRAQTDADSTRPRGDTSDDTGKPRVTYVDRDRASRPLTVNEDWNSGKDTAYSYVPRTPNLIDAVKTDGRVTGETTYRDGTRTKYGYDELDRNTKVSVWTDTADTGAADRITDLRWWPSGDQQEISKPKTTSATARTKEQRYYDTAGLVRQRETTSADGTDQRSVAYAYDINGNRTRDERGGLKAAGSESAKPGYFYNARDQLTKWVRSKNAAAPAQTEADPAKTVTYTLDGAGRQTHTSQEIKLDRPNDAYGNITTQVETENRFSGDQLFRSERSIKVTQPTSSRPDDEYQTDCYAYGAMGSQTLTIRATKKGTPGTQPTDTAPTCPTNLQAQSGWRTENQNTYDTFERLVASRQRTHTDGTGTDAGTLADNQAYCYDGLDRRDRRLTNLAGTQNPGENDDNTTAFQKARAACSQATTGGVGVYDYSYLGLTEQLTRENQPGGPQSYEYTATGQRLGRLKRPSAGGTQWRSYETDAQGSVVGLESPTTGKVNTDSQYDTDPYGDPVGPETGTSADATDRAQNPFRFQGFYKDHETGNYDMQARTYRPAIGQFLQQDRFADAGADLALASDPLTSSRYAFTAGNPSSRAEYNGHTLADQTERAQRNKSDKDVIASDQAAGRKPDAGAVARDAGFKRGIKIQTDYEARWHRPLYGYASEGGASTAGSADRAVAAAKQVTINVPTPGQALSALKGVIQGTAELPGKVYEQNLKPSPCDPTDPSQNVQLLCTVFGIQPGNGTDSERTANALALAPIGRILSSFKLAAELVAIQTRARVADEALPTITFSRSKMPAVVGNVERAQSAGHPSVLTRAERDSVDKRRRQALKGVDRAPAGKSLDEYPFASTCEGGSGACVAAVPAGENSSQGGQLSAFYRQYDIEPGDRFRVAVGK